VDILREELVYLTDQWKIQVIRVALSNRYSGIDHHVI